MYSNSLAPTNRGFKMSKTTLSLMIISVDNRCDYSYAVEFYTIKKHDKNKSVCTNRTYLSYCI